MTKPTTRALAPALPASMLLCAGIGLLLGRAVLAIAARHGGSTLGLVLALVFVLSSGASTTLVLAHRHAERRPRTEPAPLRAWLLAQGAGLLAAVHGQALLGALA